MVLSEGVALTGSDRGMSFYVKVGLGLRCGGALWECSFIPAEASEDTRSELRDFLMVLECLGWGAASPIAVEAACVWRTTLPGT